MQLDQPRGYKFREISDASQTYATVNKSVLSTLDVEVNFSYRRIGRRSILVCLVPSRMLFVSSRHVSAENGKTET